MSGETCGRPFPCWSKSTSEGIHWSGFTPVGKGNGTYGGGEGTLGTALLNGNLLSPFSVKNCSEPSETAVNRVLISSDHSKTWKVKFAAAPIAAHSAQSAINAGCMPLQVGGPSPTIVDGTDKPWGESAVAELANGSVVLTSRLSQPLTAASRWRGFAISHDGGESWDKAWTFPANQVPRFARISSLTVAARSFSSRLCFRPRLEMIS